MVEDRKSIDIRYFALLREERGLGRETVETLAATAQELFEELQSKHGFSLPLNKLNVSVNEEIKPWSTKLKAHDTVVFIPPVAGG